MIKNKVIIVLCLFIMSSYLFGQRASITQGYAQKNGNDGACVTLKARYTRPKPQHTVLGTYDERDMVVVKFIQPTRIRLREGELTDLDGKQDLLPLKALLSQYPGLIIKRIFSRPEEDIEHERMIGEADICQELGDLNLYYLLDLRLVPAVQLESLIDGLNALSVVELAYRLADPEPAVLPPEVIEAVRKQASEGNPVSLSNATSLFVPPHEPTTPGNYEPMQMYLDQAPLGIDAEWAWTLTGRRGSNAKYIDIENNWNLWHDDLGTEFVHLPPLYIIPAPTCDGYGDCDFNSYQNHATAVIGVVSSSNDGIGTTGIAVDAGYGTCQQVEYGTVADCLNVSSAFLDPGDILMIEAHAKGPVCGETCPCNCGQFEYVPMEYWQEIFDAIQVAVANGRIVVEAGANGSMNLDHACYGGLFDRSVRDSNAILVGAGDPGVPHTPSCFTDYGDRVDMYGWGDGVVTLGYGGLYPGLPVSCGPGNVNCTDNFNVLYAGDFAGTSSAAPIVAGAAAIMQGVSKTKYSRIITPLEMRDYLQINGTPQGAPTDHHIEPLPNLFGSIRADLMWYLRSGWYDILVPRSTADANCNNVTLPATLPGFTVGTYLNSSGVNYGVYEANNFWDLYSVDDVGVVSVFQAVSNPLRPVCEINVTLSGTPISVKGGRHTLRVDWDFQSMVNEWYEDNNYYARQYVWSPFVLTNHSQTMSSAPPDRDSTGYVYYNIDGYAFQLPGGSGSWWGGVGMLPTNIAHDYDVRLFNDYVGSTQGFGDYLKQSAWSAGLSDFVLANGNIIGSTATRWAGVMQATGTPDTSNVMLEYDAGPSVYAIGTHGPYTIGYNQIIDVIELYFTPGSVGLYHDFKLINDGSADLGFSLYAPTADYAAKSDFVPGGYADTYGQGSDESFTLQITQSGYYALAVWKYNSYDLPLESNYTITIELSKPNFILDTPAGWSYPLIPRNTNGCTDTTCAITPTLQGDAAATWMNYHGRNNAPVEAAVSSFRSMYYLDDQMLWFINQTGPIPANSSFYDVNTGSFTIKGGRHTLGLYVDDQDYVDESDETDNTYYQQFVWSPYTLTNGVTNQRTAPPKRVTTGANYFNCDGYQYSTGWWGVVGLLPETVTDNYDLQLHDDYAGSETGFETWLKQSYYNAGFSDFVMTNANDPSVPYGSTWYTCIRQAYDVPTSTGDYRIQEVNSTVAVVPPGLFGPYTISSYGILGAHEIYFDANSVNRIYFFRLLNDSGGNNLGFGLYGPSQPYYAKNEALAYSDVYGSGEDEYFFVTVPEAAYYGLVVWKNNTADLPQESSYRYAAVMVLPYQIDQNTLHVARSTSPPGLVLTWGPDCNARGSTNYSLYYGNLDVLRTTGTYDYTASTPVCDAGADLTEYIPMPSGNVFFIVTPHDGSVEGSYGTTSEGVQRTPAGDPIRCHPQLAATACLE